MTWLDRLLLTLLTAMIGTILGYLLTRRSAETPAASPTTPPATETFLQQLVLGLTGLTKSSQTPSADQSVQGAGRNGSESPEYSWLQYPTAPANLDPLLTDQELEELTKNEYLQTLRTHPHDGPIPDEAHSL